MFLMEKWARFGIKQERDARGLDEEDEEGQELKGAGKISDESPIDEDNLQNLLGPRCVFVVFSLLPTSAFASSCPRWVVRLADQSLPFFGTVLDWQVLGSRIETCQSLPLFSCPSPPPPSSPFQV